VCLNKTRPFPIQLFRFDRSVPFKKPFPLQSKSSFLTASFQTLPLARHVFLLTERFFEIISTLSALLFNNTLPSLILLPLFKNSSHNSQFLFFLLEPFGGTLPGQSKSS